MAVLSVRPTFEGRDGTAVGPIDSLYQNAMWKITTNSASETKESIYAQCKTGGTGGVGVAGTLPGLFTAHPDNLFYTCRRLIIEPLQAKFAWIARGEYSTAPISKDEQERETYPNPVDRPTRISKKFAKQQAYVTEDLSGNALLNSAGDPFPAQPRTISSTVYRVSKNVASWSSGLDALEDTVNETQYTITDGVKTIVIPALRAIARNLEVSERQTENGYDYYTVSGELHLGKSTDAWKLRLLDDGFHYLDGSERKRILIKDANGNDIVPAETQLLDGSGGILAVGGTPEFITFDDWEDVATWTDLPFGTAA